MDEFTGRPTGHTQFKAYTWVIIDYEYSYLFMRRGQLIQARLDKFDASGAFVPEKSWIRDSSPYRLVDHEQGHFDLMEIHARLLKKEVAKQRSKLVGQAATQDAAVKSLRSRLDVLYRQQLDKAMKAQAEYDRLTLHGELKTPQAEHRKRQKEQLSELGAKWEKRR